MPAWLKTWQCLPCPLCFSGNHLALAGWSKGPVLAVNFSATRACSGHVPPNRSTAGGGKPFYRGQPDDKQCKVSLRCKMPDPANKRAEITFVVAKVQAIANGLAALRLRPCPLLSLPPPQRFTNAYELLLRQQELESSISVSLLKRTGNSCDLCRCAKSCVHACAVLSANEPISIGVALLNLQETGHESPRSYAPSLNTAWYFTLRSAGMASSPSPSAPQSRG